MTSVESQAKIEVLEVFPYLCVRGAAEAINFYVRAFGAKELFRLAEPSGRIGHAEIQVGSTTIMLADEYPECGFRSPLALGGTPFAIHLHVSDVDALMRRAVAAGATVVRELKNEFYGERSGKIRDPYGHEWLLGQHIEDETTDEMQRRYDELMRTADK